MADAQIAIIDGDQTQVVLAPGENPAIVSSIPGPQGPAGAGVPLGGTTNQVLFKQSGTNYDTAWGPITSAMIGDLEIVNADVSASAAIAGTKISPNFGSQNVVTTGTSTAASFIPSSSTVPTNGLYLSAANSVALSTNGQGRLFVDANGNVGVGGTTPGYKFSVNGSIFIQGASTAQVRMQSASGSGSWYYWGENTVADRGVLGYAAGSGDLVYRSGAFDLASGSERLRITSTGQLSHIGAGSSGSPAVSFSGSAASNSLVVDSSSRVGIGTSSPDTILHTAVSQAGSAAVNIFKAQATNTTNNVVTRLDLSAEPALGTASVLRFSAITGNAADSCNMAFNIRNASASTEVLRISSSGRVGIGTTSVDAILHTSQTTTGVGTGLILENKAASGATTACQAVWKAYDGSSVASIGGISALSSSFSFGTYTANSFNILSLKSGGLHLRTPNAPIVFSNNGSDIDNVGERARIDSSGRLLVGTSSSRNIVGNNSRLQVEGNTFDSGVVSITCNENSSAGGGVLLGKSRGGVIGSNTIVAQDDRLGTILFAGADGTNQIQGATIIAAVDGTPGANDMPGRLVFSTTADGAASPTERMRISANGETRFLQTAAGNGVVLIDANSASYTSSMQSYVCATAASSAWHFLYMYSASYGDAEFRFRGDGQAYADGAWNGGGADYAEFFEWSDSNPNAEDRRGISVVLDGDKIREAQADEDPIGVISGNPSVVGDAAWNKWSGKYLRDEFGTYIQEDYEVEDDDGNIVVQQRRKLNPAYDPDVEYISREQRPEWDCVGLMGKLRIRKGQVTGSRWIKMRDINDSVEEWLVR